jgi:hypothetical protein
MPDPTPEERAAAQAFARAHGNLDLGALKTALDAAYGDAWQAGIMTATQQTGATVVAGLDGLIVPANWDDYWATWQPGNIDAAVKLSDGGLADLLDQADGALNGDSVDTIAAALGDYLDDPARAFQIADTELARAVTGASFDQYLAAGVNEVDWLASPGACPICEDFAGNSPYPLRDFPDLPAHPVCRCSSSPRDSGPL